jgi:hypothetical protein
MKKTGLSRGKWDEWEPQIEWSRENSGNGNATRGRLRNSTPRQPSKSEFSQLRCRILPSVRCSNVLLWFIFFFRRHERLIKLLILFLCNLFSRSLTYMTSAKHSMLGRTKEIWLLKEFHMGWRSLDHGYVLSKQYKQLSSNCNGRSDVPNVFFSDYCI